MALVTPRRINAFKRPPRLTEGDTILIVSPASPPTDSAVFRKAKRYFSQCGYRVEFGEHAKDTLGFLAGNDRARLADLNRGLRSKSVRAILCVRGGYGTGRIIHGIDFAALRRDPKIIVGCSDLTTILSGAASQSRVISFHGPTVQSLMDSECPAFTKNSLMHQISGAKQARGSILSDYPDAKKTIDVVGKGRATGRLLGGNLSIILSLIGTPFLPSFDGAILCLEDVGEPPFRIDRALTHLINLGLLQSVQGFALGIFDRCAYRAEEARRKQTLRDVIVDRLKPLKKPIVMGLPFGHVPFNATLPLGALATLDATKGDLVLEQMGVG